MKGEKPSVLIELFVTPYEEGGEVKYRVRKVRTYPYTAVGTITYQVQCSFSLEDVLSREKLLREMDELIAWWEDFLYGELPRTVKVGVNDIEVDVELLNVETEEYETIDFIDLFRWQKVKKTLVEATVKVTVTVFYDFFPTLETELFDITRYEEDIREIIQTTGQYAMENSLSGREWEAQAETTKIETEIKLSKNGFELNLGDSSPIILPSLKSDEELLRSLYIGLSIFGGHDENVKFLLEVLAPCVSNEYPYEIKLVYEGSSNERRSRLS